VTKREVGSVSSRNRGEQSRRVNEFEKEKKIKRKKKGEVLAPKKGTG